MKKIDYNKGRFILATTEGEFEWADYIDFCMANGITPTREDFNEWCYEEAQRVYEDDLDNLKEDERYNVPVVITGTLGLWWGRPNVEPVVEDSVYDAVVRCSRSGEIVEVAFDNGEIIVSASHHDGTNVFTINAISKKAQNKDFARWGVGKGDTKRLPYIYA